VRTVPHLLVTHVPSPFKRLISVVPITPQRLQSQENPLEHMVRIVVLVLT
jgi:hypothetical protein